MRVERIFLIGLVMLGALALFVGIAACDSREHNPSASTHAALSSHSSGGDPVIAAEVCHRKNAGGACVYKMTPTKTLPLPKGEDIIFTSINVEPGSYFAFATATLKKADGTLVSCQSPEQSYSVNVGEIKELSLGLTCNDGSSITKATIKACVFFADNNDAGTTSENPCSSSPTLEPASEPTPQDGGNPLPPTAGCKTDQDCQTGENCDVKSGTCLTTPPPGSCTSDSECSSTEYCNGGKCALKPTQPPVDCTASCSKKCGLLPDGCKCGQCSPSWTCGTNNTCQCAFQVCGTQCIDTKTSKDHCGDCNRPCSKFCLNGSCLECRQDSDCANGDSCKSGTCTPPTLPPECTPGQTQTRVCNLGGPFYCPPGEANRTCQSNSQWPSYGSCQLASTTKSYYGDGARHCGSVVCIQITAIGSNGDLSAIVTKADNSAFSNDAQLAIYSPTTGQSDLRYYYCGAIQANSNSKTIIISPSRLGIKTGQTISVNVQVLSPCIGGANYISDNGSISQCR